jgi:hypothetical protein
MGDASSPMREFFPTSPCRIWKEIPESSHLAADEESESGKMTGYLLQILK